MTFENDDLLTVKQVAEGMNISRNSVIRMVRKGHLKPYGKLPGLRGAYLFKQSAFKSATVWEVA